MPFLRDVSLYEDVFFFKFYQHMFYILSYISFLLVAPPFSQLASQLLLQWETSSQVQSQCSKAAWRRMWCYGVCLLFYLFIIVVVYSIKRNPTVTYRYGVCQNCEADKKIVQCEDRMLCIPCSMFHKWVLLLLLTLLFFLFMLLLIFLFMLLLVISVGWNSALHHFVELRDLRIPHDKLTVRSCEMLTKLPCGKDYRINGHHFFPPSAVDANFEFRVFPI